MGVSLNISWWNKLEMGRDTNAMNIPTREYSNIRPVRCLFGLYFGIHFPSWFERRFAKELINILFYVLYDLSYETYVGNFVRIEGQS
jgi:hypothetical protein